MTKRSMVLLPGLVGVLSACGSSSPVAVRTAPSPSAVSAAATAAAPVTSAAASVTVSGSGQRSVTLTVGQRLTIARGSGETAVPKDSTVLATDGDGYRAVAAGITTVPVERRPTCSPGMLCSQLIQLVGTVTVTVTG